MDIHVDISGFLEIHAYGFAMDSRTRDLLPGYSSYSLQPDK